MALAVTSDGGPTLDHVPIPDLGWPAMQMDLAVAGFDSTTVSLGTPIAFDLAKDENGRPGMTMDFAIADGIDPAALPTGEDLTLLLHRNPDSSMTLIGIAAAQSVSQ